MKYTFLLLIVLACGCMSVPKATGYLTRQGALPGICAAAFPPDTTGYIRGIIKTIHDTAEVPGPVIPCPPSTIDTITGKQAIVYVKCPPTRIIHDSTFMHDTAFVVPTGVKVQIAAQAHIIDSTTTALNVSKARANKYYAWYFGAILLISGVILSGGIWLFFKLKVKLL